MQKRFTASDFSDAMYNVLDVGDTPILQRWPELQRFIEFKFNFFKKYKLNNERVYKYAFLLYSKNILHKAIPEIAKRKAEAALLAGFEYRLDSNLFKQNIEKLIACEYPEANDLFIRVARLTRNSQFEQLVVYEEARARQMRKLLDDIGSNEKTKDIHDNIRRLSEDIERLQNEVLYEDNQKPLLDRLYFSVENIQLGIRPEEIAEMRKSGKFDAVIDIRQLENLDEKVFLRDEQERSEAEV